MFNREQWFGSGPQLGIEIPTLCYLDGADHFTSCMVA
jgi:predicted molibdopterin-dependent oxidoreductase YjgC